MPGGGGRGGLWNKINLKIPGVVLGREGRGERLF